MELFECMFGVDYLLLLKKGKKFVFKKLSGKKRSSSERDEDMDCFLEGMDDIVEFVVYRLIYVVGVGLKGE